MTDINKHVARYFNFLESDTDATFHRLHAEYSKAKAELNFHHDIDNPQHPTNHSDNKVSRAAWSHQDLVDYDRDRQKTPSDEAIKSSEQKLISTHPDVKRYYDKSDSLRKKYNASHKAMWAHIDKHGTPDSFKDTSPNHGNRDVMDKHYSSLEKAAEGK